MGLLNKARKQTEKIIDKLYEGESINIVKKPRTYREKARKEYLKVAKKRKVKNEERAKRGDKEKWNGKGRRKGPFPFHFSLTSFISD